MSDIIPDSAIDDYKHARLSLPFQYKRWHLYGAGLENVGKQGKPETVSLPHPMPHQILVRHDACGICFSDIKIIALGSDHPRLVGRDLASDPVVMGHEVALTVIKVGDNHKDQFRPGQRFIVQADVYHMGVNLAYGYALPGGMSQYGLIGPEVLQGDEGCYLLPLQEETGYVEAAMVEPWACVEAAYHWTANDAAPEALGGPTITPSKSLTYRTERGDLVFKGAPPSAKEFDAACAGLGKDATVHLLFDRSMSIRGPLKVDIGRIHYDGHRYVGAEPNLRSELKGGGVAWFVGAAGPMGQMHVQRALSLPEPPRKLICTDRQAKRLTALKERFGPLAADRGVELQLFNIREDRMPDLNALAPDGFDDIVVMVPSVEAIEHAYPFLGYGGVLNIFAGVARGTTASLDLNAVVTKNVRVVGTSGSTIEDMKTVRDKMEDGSLETAEALAAIGGLNAFRDGLEAVKESRFPGKTVIFPHIVDLPLTPLPELASVRPEVHAKLRDGRFWTNEAEDELLKEAA